MWRAYLPPDCKRNLAATHRRHGQTTLYGLLAVAYAGLPSAHSGYLFACSASFVLARVVHALAMFTRQLPLRQATHVVSVLAQLGLVLGIGALLWRLA